MKKLYGPCLAALLAALFICCAGVSAASPCSTWSYAPDGRIEWSDPQQTLQQLLEMPLIVSDDFELFWPSSSGTVLKSGLNAGLRQFLDITVLDPGIIPD